MVQKIKIGTKLHEKPTLNTYSANTKKKTKDKDAI